MHLSQSKLNKFQQLKQRWVARLADKNAAIKQYAPELARYSSDVMVDNEGRPFLVPGGYWKVKPSPAGEGIFKILYYQNEKYTGVIYANWNDGSYNMKQMTWTADEFHRLLKSKSSDGELQREIVKDKRANKI